MKCKDCGKELTKIVVGKDDTLSVFYNAGDTIGQCDNKDCVSEGSTWRIRKAKQVKA